MPKQSPPTDADLLLEEALIWLTRLNSGDVDPEIRKALTSWRAADPAHEQAWRRAEILWRNLGSLRGRSDLPGAEPLPGERRPRTRGTPGIFSR